MANQMTEDEVLEAALVMLDQPMPEASKDSEHTDAAITQSFKPGPPVSPTLAGLDETRRPRVKTVCETCPHSVWFASPAEVKCYCRVMFLVTWSTKEPNQLTHCDGPLIGQE
jgi:hypothetical protein